MATGFPKDWKARRQVVLKQANHECQIRGVHCEGAASHVDHIVRRADGGGHDFANLRAACGVCNREREGHNARKPSRIWSPLLRTRKG